MKLAFFGSKPLSLRTLKYLTEDFSHLDITMVTTPHDLELLDYASRKKMEFFTDPCDLIETYDLGIVVGYPYVIKATTLDKFRKQVLNFHFGELPKYRGSTALSHSILNGESHFAVSMHIVNDQIDAGPLVTIRKFPLPPRKTAKDLIPLIEEEAFQMIKENLPNIVAGKTLPTSPNFPKGKLYLRNSLDYLLPVDLKLSHESLDRILRALTLPNKELPFALSREGEKIYIDYDRWKIQ